MKITRRTENGISIAELKAAIMDGRGLEVIRPFDEIAFTLDTGEAVTAVCGYVGGSYARFVFKDSLREKWKMNKTAANKGGYLNSEARRHLLEDVLPRFPAELRGALAPRNLSEVIGGETHEYADTLWLPSATDVFGAGNWRSEETDSFQLPIFKTECGRVKENADEGTYFWWLRSPDANYSCRFVSVSAVGTANYGNYANYSVGFAPGFDL